MSNIEKNPKAALYCRLSEEDHNKTFPGQDSLSIRNQKSMLKQYALEHQWEIYDIYSDDDYTGADRKRPEFNRLLRDAREHRFDIILCKTQSRFTRELELVEKYIHGLFPLWGIRFISIVDNADTADKANKKSRQINGLINEWYLEDMSDNIKCVLTDRRKKGYHIGSFALYGYRKDPDIRGHLLIDEEAASVVRRIFLLFSQGYGKTAIAKQLNELGIPNPTEYKRLQGLRYRQPKKSCSALWNYSTISRILKNEIYIGNMVQGKYESISYKTKENHPRPKEQWYIVKNTHEPVIDMELWNNVQNILNQNTHPFSNGTIGIFAGKTHCMYCGCTMRSVKHKSGRRYLKCPTHALSSNACIGAFLSSEKLEKALLKELQALTDQGLDRDFFLRNLPQNSSIQDNILYQLKTTEKDLFACQKKLKEHSEVIRQLYLDRAKGILSETDFLSLSKDFAVRRQMLEQQIRQHTEQLKYLKNSITCDYPTQQYENQYTEKLLHPAQLNRLLMDIMIKDIKIGRREPAANEIPIEIHWNF